MKKPRNPFMMPSTIIEEMFAWRLYRKELEKSDPKFAEMWERRNRASDALMWLFQFGIITFTLYMLLAVVWALLTIEGELPQLVI